MPVDVQGPDGKTYSFPEGTDKAAAIAYFKKKGIGVSAPPEAPSTAKQVAQEWGLGLAGGAGMPETQTPWEDFRRSAMELAKPSPFGPVALGYRTAKGLIGQQVDVAKDIYQGIKQKDLPRIAHGIGTETGVMGMGALTAAGPKAAKVPLSESTVANLPRAVSEGLAGKTATLAQEMAGAGKEPVLAARQRYQLRLQEVERANAAKVKEAELAHADRVAKHEMSEAESRAAYDKKVAEVRAEHQAGVEKASRAYRQKLQEYRGAKKAEATVQARRETIAATQKKLTDVVMDNTQRAFRATKAYLDGRWAAFRERIKSATPADGEKMGSLVNQAVAKYLKGSPENIKLFREILGKSDSAELRVARSLGFDDVEAARSTQNPRLWQQLVEKEKAGGGDVGMSPEDVWGFKSEIGSKLASGGLPGDVYQALKFVHEGLDAELGRMAREVGQAKEHAALSKEWSQYMKDWHDMEAVSAGGSPLARVLRAQDPGFVTNQIQGKAGGRLVEQMARYERFGASPKIVRKMLQLAQQEETLPKVRVPKEPARGTVAPPEIPEAPKTKAAPEYKAPKLAEKPREVDPVEVRRRRLLEMASRPFRFYDLFPPYLVEHVLLKSPEIREWIAQHPRQELPVVPPM